MAKILILVLILMGAAGGIGAGLVLRPTPIETTEADTCVDTDPNMPVVPSEPAPEATNTAFVKLNNQFVVPVVEGDRIASLVVLSLSLEVSEGFQETVFSQEPKLRDAFLQVMFDHANTGGFDGAFTSSGKMDNLRSALQEAAKKLLGEQLVGVLIVDVVRQDA